jgi:hypothetical protein
MPPPGRSAFLQHGTDAREQGIDMIGGAEITSRRTPAAEAGLLPRNQRRFLLRLYRALWQHIFLHTGVPRCRATSID